MNYPIPSAPSLTPSVSTLFYTEGAPATAIDPGMSLADSGSSTISYATIKLSSQPGGVVLGFTNTATIAGSFSGSTLTLTGADTVANYQAALQSVTYQQTSYNPASGGPVLFSVYDGIQLSNTADVGVNVNPDQAPTMSGPASASVDQGGVLAFTGADAISVADVDAYGAETVALGVAPGC